VRTRVLLVEVVAELRAVLRQALALRPELEVVGEAADGAAGVEAAARLQPDVIVLDLGLPDLAGEDVVPRIRAVSPAAQIVVYTGSYTLEEVGSPPGVGAYVRKDRDVGYLVDVVVNLDRLPYRTDSTALGPDASDVSVARRFVVERCVGWGCPEVADDAELVASELVTNALIHAGTVCDLGLGLSETTLRLHVIDGGAEAPAPREARGEDEQGRGLLLVSLLCTAWGTEPLPGGGKVVWAELLCRSAEDQGDAAGEAFARLRLPGGDDAPVEPDRPAAGGPEALVAAGRRRVACSR
jgi:CheY-like chemotaxis protein